MYAPQQHEATMKPTWVCPSSRRVGNRRRRATDGLLQARGRGGGTACIVYSIQPVSPTVRMTRQFSLVEPVFALLYKEARACVATGGSSRGAVSRVRRRVVAGVWSHCFVSRSVGTVAVRGSGRCLPNGIGVVIEVIARIVFLRGFSRARALNRAGERQSRHAAWHGAATPWHSARERRSRPAGTAG